MFCRKCGAQLEEGAKTCPVCNEATEEKKVAPTYNGRKKSTMAIIAFLFGNLGIHNFMMGEVKKGLMKILFHYTLGISYVFAIIDFVKILTDEYEINPDSFF